MSKDKNERGRGVVSEITKSNVIFIEGSKKRFILYGVDFPQDEESSKKVNDHFVNLVRGKMVSYLVMFVDPYQNHSSEFQFPSRESINDLIRYHIEKILK